MTITPVVGHAISLQHLGRGAAGDDDMPHATASARRSLSSRRAATSAIEARLGGQRVMDERDDPQARCVRLHSSRQRTERETVDDDDGVVGNGGEHASRLRACGRVGTRKALVELVDGDGPAALPQAG